MSLVPVEDVLHDLRLLDRISVEDALRVQRRFNRSRGRRGRPQELEVIPETQEFFWALRCELEVLLEQVAALRYRSERAKAMVRREIRVYFDAARVSDMTITEVAEAAIGTNHISARIRAALTVLLRNFVPTISDSFVRNLVYPTSRPRNEPHRRA